MNDNHINYNPVCTYDFTIWETIENSSTIIKEDDIKTTLEKTCKKWAFQKEKAPTTGKIHFQGRISLKIKAELPRAKKVLAFGNHCHLTPTSSPNKGNDFYVMKEETRVSGPWTDRDKKPTYIPRDIREINDVLLPWQQYLKDLTSQYERRKIRYVYDVSGCNGKTIFTRYMCVKDLAEEIPFCNDFKDIMQMAYCVGIQPLYIIDMPRSIDKERLKGLYAAIEKLKDGFCYDMRHTYKFRRFDPPQVIVFSNSLPNKTYLSTDRWDFYTLYQKELFRGLHLTEEQKKDGKTLEELYMA